MRLCRPELSLQLLLPEKVFLANGISATSRMPCCSLVLPPPHTDAGAGKTNVAMLCIMHELGMHRKPDGKIDTAAFKIVYVAPMKALVAEMVGNFSTRLGEAYGLKVRELTGEHLAKHQSRAQF